MFERLGKFEYFEIPFCIFAHDRSPGESAMLNRNGVYMFKNNISNIHVFWTGKSS